MRPIDIILVVIACLLAILIGFLYLMGNPSPSEPALIKRIRRHKSGLGRFLSFLAHGLFHPRLLCSGASRVEKRMPLPGDELVAKPQWKATLAKTIDAPVEYVWPWLVQLGGGRADWYLPPPLSAFAELPAEPANEVWEILPQFQQLEVGDRLSNCRPQPTAECGDWEVKSIEDQQHIILYAACQVMEGDSIDRSRKKLKGMRFISSWVFVLQPLGENRSRLLARVRATGGPALAVGLMKLLFGHGGSVAQKGMLEGITDRAEIHYLSREL